MKPAFTRAGKRGWDSISGPCMPTGAASASATTCTACGLPMDTAVIATAAPRDIQRLDEGVGIGLEGDARRFEHRHAHVDRDLTIVLRAQRDHATLRFDPDFPLVGQTLFDHEAHETARAIAALLHLAAIGIENAVAEIDIRPLRALDHQQLVAADAEVAVSEKAHLLGRQVDLLANRVDHDEIVAQAVHLGKTELHSVTIVL
jgi:hypothetical protein